MRKCMHLLNDIKVQNALKKGEYPYHEMVSLKKAIDWI